MGRRAAGLAFAAFLVGANAGCAGRVDVTRTYTPDAAARVQNASFEPVAVVRDGKRTELPAGARIEGERVVLPEQAGTIVHELQPGDVIEQDDQGRIVAVRSAGRPRVVTHFVPGTATSPDGSNEVRGRLLDGDAGTGSIVLSPSDSVEMHGRFDPGERIPGGARVECRSMGTSVAGIVVLVLGYAPAAYVGAASPQHADRVLLAPVAGPWIDLSARPKCVPPPGSQSLPVDPCLGDTAARAALVTSGAVQGLGFLLTVLGLPSHSALAPDADRPSRSAGVHFVPTLGGAAAVGTF